MTSLDTQSSEANPDNMNEETREYVVRARGLPWSATVENVAEFFSGCNICGGAKNGIHFTYSDGRPSGECFVELVSRDDLEKALAKSNNFIGKRYVEVFESKAGEMEWTCKRMGQPQDRGNEAVVRLRGLPFEVSKEEIAQFFTGLEIVPNGITITLDEDGRTTGDAFVEFASPDIATQALKKNKETIGHRYIEIFKSSKADIKYVSKPKLKPLMSTRPGPYDRSGGGFGGGRGGRFGAVVAGDGRRFRGRGNLGGPVFGGGYGGDGFGGGGGGGGGRGGPGRGGRGGRGRGGFRNQGRGGGGGNFGMMSSTGHTVHMRGLPFAAKENDVKQFFMPLNPVNIWMEYSSGSFTGEVDVDFATHDDAQAAMLKNKATMGHRYIELFLRSQPGVDEVSNRGWGGSGGGQNFSSGNSGGGNFSNNNFGGGNFGGNFNDSNNFSNFGGGGNNFGGNQGNMGGFGGQGNQGSGFNNQQQQQQQQGSFGNQMGGGTGGGFGNQGNTFGGNTGGFNSGPGGGNFSSQSSYGQNTNYGGTGFGGQMSSGMNTGMNTGINTGLNTGMNTGSYGAQGGGYNNPAQQSTPFNQQQQQQQQQQSGYGDTSAYGAAGSGSFFGSMQTQIKQESQGTGTPGMVSYPGYQ